MNAAWVLQGCIALVLFRVVETIGTRGRLAIDMISDRRWASYGDAYVPSIRCQVPCEWVEGQVITHLVQKRLYAALPLPLEPTTDVSSETTKNTASLWMFPPHDVGVVVLDHLCELRAP